MTRIIKSKTNTKYFQDIQQFKENVNKEQDTYKEFVSFKSQLSDLKDELVKLHNSKIQQERTAVKLRNEFNLEWNKYLSLAEQENKQREKIINFVMEN